MPALYPGAPPASAIHSIIKHSTRSLIGTKRGSRRERNEKRLLHLELESAQAS